MLRNLFLLGTISLALASCANDAKTPETAANNTTVNSDIRNLESVDNSSLVNNPISADTPVNADEMGVLTFKETTIDFGTIKEGDVVTKTFEFTNTGKSPIVISDAKASCGCTVPEYPKAPIQPGESSKIVAKFDSSKKSGPQTKNITITANTMPNQTILTLKGEIIGSGVAQ